MKHQFFSTDILTVPTTSTQTKKKNPSKMTLEWTLKNACTYVENKTYSVIIMKETGPTD